MIIAYGTVAIEGLEINVYYDAADTAYIKCNDANKKLGFGTSVVYPLKLDDCFVATSNGNGVASLIRLDVIESALYPRMKKETSRARVEKFFEMVVAIERHPIDELEPASSPKQQLPVPVNRMTMLNQLVGDMKFLNHEDIANYTQNIQRVLTAEKRLSELKDSVDGAFILERPDTITTIAEAQTLLRNTFDLWVAELQYRHACHAFESAPTELFAILMPPEQNKREPHKVGIPLSPQMIEESQAPNEAIEREYDMLVSYLVKHTSDDFGKVKHVGYAALEKEQGVTLLNVNNGKKPIDIIRERGWWSEHYGALWHAYETVLRHIEGQ